MKKLLALVLALCTAAALCACGHDSAAKTKPNEESTADKGTLTLAYWEENCPEWWEKVYADTGIKVEYEQIASADYANIMSTRVKGGEAPDIFFSRNEDLGKMYAENGFVEPMADMALVNDKVSAGVVDIMKTMFGETIYGIPVNVSYTGLLFYNQDIFDEVGVELPQNMDEFVAVCDKLVAAGYTPFINGASETNHIKHFSFCPFMINNLNGQQEWLKGLKDGTSSFMDEEWMTAMQYMQDGLKYSDPSSIGLTHVEAWAQFAEGSAVMLTGSSYMFDQNYAVVTPEFNMGVTACPYNYEGDPHICISGQNNVMFVNAKSANKELAMEYYDYFLNHLEDYAKITGVPAPFAVKDGETTTEWSSYSKLFDTLATLPGYVQVTLPSTVESDFNAFMQGMILGDITINDMADLQAKLEASLG